MATTDDVYCKEHPHEEGCEASDVPPYVKGMLTKPTMFERIKGMFVNPNPPKSGGRKTRRRRRKRQRERRKKRSVRKV